MSVPAGVEPDSISVSCPFDRCGWAFIVMPDQEPDPTTLLVALGNAHAARVAGQAIVFDTLEREVAAHLEAEHGRIITWVGEMVRLRNERDREKSWSQEVERRVLEAGADLYWKVYGCDPSTAGGGS